MDLKGGKMPLSVLSLLGCEVKGRQTGWNREADIIVRRTGVIFRWADVGRPKEVGTEELCVRRAEGLFVKERQGEADSDGKEGRLRHEELGLGWNGVDEEKKERDQI